MAGFFRSRLLACLCAKNAICENEEEVLSLQTVVWLVRRSECAKWILTLEGSYPKSDSRDDSQLQR